MLSHCVCRLCGADLTDTFVDLGMSPLCESYVPAEHLDEPETFYPLHVRQCSSCLLVQLPAYVPGEEIFSDYAYFSSYSDSWVAHAKRYADGNDRATRPQLGQPGDRGGEQRRLSAAAFRRRGRPGAGGRTSGKRRRGRTGPGHPHGGRVPGLRTGAEIVPQHGRADLVVGEQRFRPRPRHPGLRQPASALW